MRRTKSRKKRIVWVGPLFLTLSNCEKKYKSFLLLIKTRNKTLGKKTTRHIIGSSATRNKKKNLRYQISCYSVPLPWGQVSIENKRSKFAKRAANEQIYLSVCVSVLENNFFQALKFEKKGTKLGLSFKSEGRICPFDPCLVYL